MISHLFGKKEKTGKRGKKRVGPSYKEISPPVERFLQQERIFMLKLRSCPLLSRSADYTFALGFVSFGHSNHNPSSSYHQVGFAAIPEVAVAATEVAIAAVEFVVAATIFLLDITASLEFMPDGWAKEVPSDIESLTTEKIYGILNQFVEDFKEGSLETKGWPTHMSAYVVSKAALNAYTRILAKKYPSFCINAVCPGPVKTDLSHNNGQFTPDEGADCVLRLALLPNGSSSGLFFHRSEVRPF